MSGITLSALGGCFSSCLPVSTSKSRNGTLGLARGVGESGGLLAGDGTSGLVTSGGGLVAGGGGLVAGGGGLVAGGGGLVGGGDGDLGVVSRLETIGTSYN